MLGIKIKKARERAGMTRSELARKSGISRVTIWALESGKQQTTTTHTLSCIADALGISLEILFSPDRSE